MSKRPFKHTNLLLLEGKGRHRVDPEKEVKPAPFREKMPTNLSKYAKRVYKRLAPMFNRLGLLTELDGEMFHLLCECGGRLEWIHLELQKKDIDEKYRMFLMKEERLYLNIFRQYASEFGMSPRGRIGMLVYQDYEDDAFSKLLD
jgi:P27 family predicted phage terminase small subunit